MLKEIKDTPLELTTHLYNVHPLKSISLIQVKNCQHLIFIFVFKIFHFGTFNFEITRLTLIVDIFKIINQTI